MSAGITAQYGFLFQRYVFILSVISNASMNHYFTYEGVDDIDANTHKRDDGISMIDAQCNKLLQVKSGDISTDCWSKVLGNWILSGTDSLFEHELVCEKYIPFDVQDDSTIEKVYDYFLAGKGKKRTSIARKVYDQLFGSMPEKEIKELIKKLTTNSTISVKSIDQVIEEIEKIYTVNYCTDITIYPRAKLCRCNRFIGYVLNNIEKAIEEKNKYVIDFTELMKVVTRVGNEISDQRYSADLSELDNKKRKDAEDLIKNGSMREIEQLKLVNPDIGFVAYELARELMYKDFREVYCDVGYEISNIEEMASSNFRDVSYENGTGISPKELFDKTTARAIDSSLLGNSSIYRHGCYVYLTGDDIDPNKQITWG